MNKIALIINSSKDLEKEIEKNLIMDIRDIFPKTSIVVFNKISDKELQGNLDIDMVITVGGDGTVLSSSKIICKYEIPIFAVNYGNLGFLTAIEKDDFKKALAKIKNKEYYIEKRIMIQCDVEGKNTSYHCLNDIVISKGTLSRIVEYEITIDDKPYMKIKADGIIVSTPTGSTAYAMSAGGPILYPTLQVLSITPICPHIMTMKTMIIDSKSQVKIIAKNASEQVYLTLDGQQYTKIDKEDIITIKEYEHRCNLIRLQNYDYFDTLNKKIIPCGYRREAKK
ncbi:NAD(+)/NADH kinase [Clostridium cellulovorans]|uniref:NAD kinase n=1 Tax=Clostridium cellulovorans (strain ATCC 35296 / DSM 3052 / OCM 3 / 743B) TaxID=573061 RepID=D9SLV2_CLOC7|nr:NAD(+)/NADH kinase [Clostridium cellulovorans]ADL51683.1 ATP-NAD/AcoX kinase [Clostridium cellulovorans 743B]